MPRYRARYFGELPGTEPFTIRRIAQGEEFEYDGKPGLWMEPIEDGDAPLPEDDKSPDTLHGIAKVEFKQRQDALAALEGKPTDPPKRGPGRPPKSSY